jgi:hypothetical protein
MILAHLLKDLDEEADLDLSGLLEQGIESSSAFSFAEDPEPLLYSAKLILEVLVEGGSSHLLECCLILIDIGNPLLGQFILGVELSRAMALTLLRLAIEVGGGPDGPGTNLTTGEGGNIGRGTGEARASTSSRADGPRGRRSQRRDMARLGGAVAITHEVGRVNHDESAGA